MSRPTVTIIGADGAASNDTHPVPEVFKVSATYRDIFLCIDNLRSLAAARPSQCWTQGRGWMEQFMLAIWARELSSGAYISIPASKRFSWLSGVSQLLPPNLWLLSFSCRQATIKLGPNFLVLYRTYFCLVFPPASRFHHSKGAGQNSIC